MRITGDHCAVGFAHTGFTGPAETGYLLVKVTCAVRDRELVLPDEQFAIWETPQLHDGHTLPTDALYRKEGADLLVMGDVFAPRGKPVPLSAARVALADFQETLVVWGDRFWKKGITGHVPTEPEPFTRMPVTWARAYGGVWRDAEGAELPYWDNPEGKGFLFPNHPHTPKTIAGTPLPNIEWSNELIQSPEDMPSPAGTAYYPTFWGMRLRAGVEPDGMKPPKMKRALFNQAHPRFVLPGLPDDGLLRIEGMREDGPFEARFRPPRVAASIVRGSREIPLPLHAWDMLVVFPAEARMYLVSRTSIAFEPLKEEDTTLRVTATLPP